MKKIIGFKNLILGIICLIIIGVTTMSYATDSVLETGNSTVTEITSSEYDNASIIPVDTNTTTGTTNTSTNTTTSTSTGTNTESVYTTVDEDNSTETIPQTGIEDGYVGVLLIVFVAVSIFTYKKMKDYKNI